MLAGTDCPFDGMEDITVAWELACMVEYGLNPLEAIATATGHAARVLGLEGQIGGLTTGAYADILVAAGDASQDIGALKQVIEVFHNGAKVTGLK
jgi:imidazolonepropionase-like amidohydrolase